MGANHSLLSHDHGHDHHLGQSTRHTDSSWVSGFDCATPSLKAEDCCNNPTPQHMRGVEQKHDTAFCCSQIQRGWNSPYHHGGAHGKEQFSNGDVNRVYNRGEQASAKKQLTPEEAHKKLWRFSQEGRAHMLEALFDLKSNMLDVNAEDPGGNTALQLAAKNGHLQAVKVLMFHGAHYSKDRSGHSPGQLAAQNKHLDVEKFLCQYDEELLSSATRVGSVAPEKEPVADPKELWIPKHFDKEHMDVSLKAVALHNFAGEDKEPIFGDTRPEIWLNRGDVMKILDYNDNRCYCLVQPKKSSKIGWVPANFISTDGKTPYKRQEKKSPNQSPHHSRPLNPQAMHKHKVYDGQTTHKHHEADD